MPPVAFQLAGSVFFDFESSGQGVTLANMNTLHNNVTVAALFGIMCADIALFALLTWYLDAVLPTEFGMPQPPLFCCSAGFWREACRREDGDAQDRSLVEPLCVAFIPA
jgi:hypothetical protein